MQEMRQPEVTEFDEPGAYAEFPPSAQRAEHERERAAAADDQAEVRTT
jgi:hypothetical protein